jgi:hypothetical protein
MAATPRVIAVKIRRGWCGLRSHKRETRTLFDLTREIEGGSPRAVAVVAAAFVEEHLTKLIRSRLIKDKIKSKVDPHKEMFRPGGPLGDFGNKNSLDYLMGFITKVAWQELDIIRKVRNEFAHKVEVNRWNIQNVSTLCASLVLWERLKIKLRRSDTAKSGALTLLMGENVADDEQEFPMIDLIDKEPPLLANERYVAACKFYVAAFSIMIHEEYTIPTPSV